MGITVGLNVAKSLETTVSKNIFMDVPKDGSVRGRYLPAVAGSEGSLFGYTKNHFRLRSEDGERGIAVGCNEVHNKDEVCVLCEVQKYLRDSDDKNERVLGEGRESIKANGSWYGQFMPAIKDDVVEGKPVTYTYGEVRFVRLPKTGAEKVGNIMKMQYENGEPSFVDEKQGRDLVLSRVDTGVQFTQYDAMTVGMPSALEDIRPNWEKEIYSWDKFWEKLDVKTLSAEEQKVALIRSYPELDWEAIFKAVGV